MRYQLLRGPLQQESYRRQCTAQAKQLLLPERGRLRDVWDTASLEWRASVIKLLVKRVVIDPGRPGGGLYEGRWRFDPELVKVEWAE